MRSVLALGHISKPSFTRIRFVRLYSQNIVSETPPKRENVDHEEVQTLNKSAQDWWNPRGSLKALHSMNKLRVPFIRDGIVSSKSVKPENIGSPRVLEGTEILEVGCGGGILTEPLARLHAQVTGLDLGEDLLKVAEEHLEEALRCRVKYLKETVEEHSKKNISRYDAVVASEVLEHVSDKVSFLEACVLATKPGGSVFVTTLNKTQIAWFGGICVAENVLGLAPKGAHNWDKFVSPEEVENILRNFDCRTVMVHGMKYEFWRDNWEWTKVKDINYALYAVKE